MKNDVVPTMVQSEVEPILEQNKTVKPEGTAPKTNDSFSVVRLWDTRKQSKRASTFRRKQRIVTGIGY